jgi:regulator of RNase E activity RraA
VVVIPRAHAAEVIAAAEAHNAKEQRAQAAIDAGTYDRAWVLDSLRAKGCAGA